MRRLLRWTFNTLADASLLLCAATAGLWMRSYWVADLFHARRPEASDVGRTYGVQHYRCVIASGRGQLGGSLTWSRRNLFTLAAGASAAGADRGREPNH